MIKAVIFDMDGTLLDTEKYYIMFWPKALEHFGYQITREQILTMRSLGRPYAAEHLKKAVLSALKEFEGYTPEELRDHRYQRFRNVKFYSEPSKTKEKSESPAEK